MSLRSDNAWSTVELQRQRDELLAACKFVMAHECNNQPCPVCYKKAADAVASVTSGQPLTHDEMIEEAKRDCR